MTKSRGIYQCTTLKVSLVILYWSNESNMKSSRLTFELDHIWQLNSLLVDYLHQINRFRYYNGTPINIKRIKYENKRNNNIY